MKLTLLLTNCVYSPCDEIVVCMHASERIFLFLPYYSITNFSS